MNITIETRDTTTVYGIRHNGPYMEIDKAFNALWDWVVAVELPTQVTCGMAIFHDDPTKTAPQSCRSDACVQLKQPPSELQLSEIVKPIEIAGGCFALYRHIGPYSALEPVYHQFYHQWLPASDYQKTAQPSFEIYINNPLDTPPDELITDIYFPVMAK